MPSSGPIIVLGSGMRCGTTLVQRLLSSHPDVMIWGEHMGQLTRVLDAADRLYTWDDEQSARARVAFTAAAYQSFMSNLLPGREAIAAAARAFMVALFAEPAAALGCPRWGFKEVRYGANDARRVHDLFPGLRVIHVTRNPADVLVSLDWWERSKPDWIRDWTHASLRHWARINAEFGPLRGTLPYVMHVRYEDLLADPPRFADELAGFVDINADGFDRCVFERRVHSSGPDGADPRQLRGASHLPRQLRRLLRDPRLRALGADYGYEW